MESDTVLLIFLFSSMPESLLLGAALKNLNYFKFASFVGVRDSILPYVNLGVGIGVTYTILTIS